MNSFQILWQFRDAFLGGLAVTFQLVLLTAIIGTCAGIALELFCSIAGHYFRFLVDGVAFGISAIPALVILFWLYYPAQSLLHISFSPFLTALIALSLINSFVVYRITADAVREFPKQYVATAQVCGLTPLQMVRYVHTPLLLRASLPRWIDQQVVILQTSVFASLISVDEVFRAAQRINSVTYQPVIIYTAMALLFLITAGSAMYVAKLLRARFYRDFSER
jgi:ABC-type amino acid transport system permease subunit